MNPEAVRRATRDEIVAITGAWADGEQAVEGFLRRVVADLHRQPSTVVEHAEFGNYGSGYASFAEVFITSRDGTRRRTDSDVDGLSLCLCRLAPFAVLSGFPSSRSSVGLRARGPTGPSAAPTPPADQAP